MAWPAFSQIWGAIVAVETLRLPGVSGRYAAALYDLAQEAAAVDAVLADLEKVGQALSESPELSRLVHSPLVGRTDQERALAALFAKMGIGQVVSRLVGVMARNRRLSALKEVVRDYGLLVASARGEIVADVISAAPLSDGQLHSIKAALQSAAAGLGAKSVAVKAKVDPALIGGVVVKFGSRMIDASVRAKLSSLNRAMKGVG